MVTRYEPAPDRYDRMTYRRCGCSGLDLPAVSLGLWHNFGHDRPLDTSAAIVRRAFDLGVTHFDLANNYGPPYGSAEENFGRLLRRDLAPFRDELVISTKAGYDMWPGPYGDHGSRKYLLASLDQSLRRPAGPRPARGRGAAQRAGAQRDRRGPRPDARPDGARVDAPRRARHLDARRCEQCRPARQQRGRARPGRVQRRRAGRDRPP